MRGRSGHDKAKPQSGRISALAGRQGRLRACIPGLPQSNLQRSRNLVTTSIIKSDGVPRPVAGGGGAFQWWGGAPDWQTGAGFMMISLLNAVTNVVLRRGPSRSDGSSL